ncbi:serine/threonine-protein kinase TBK1-like isoform X2 [Physella acuta]|nr:serine/threonine-protein kinase TBK1-like isoform X2 [Physella acuta]
MRSVLIMEYCEGGSLHHMLDQPLYYYGLVEEEYILVLKHVAEGIQYLRQENVIHRDIKPGNIMRHITTDGNSIYKLTDFGAARKLDDDESFQSLYGTEEYLHPGIYERAVLKLPTGMTFDAKVDLWSLGVTFYHTATGQLPFQPYGGRANKQTMFKIITEKESGVISGVQNFENAPIQWRRDLPETSPLSSGLKSIVIPMLAGLMEPNAARMLTYESLFRIVQNISTKINICVFHYTRCEDLRIYADGNTTYTGLQDLVASLTDIVAADQILLVAGKCLDEIVDPSLQLKDYPSHILHDSIYLFQKEKSETARISKPEIPSMPDFNPTSDMDGDARLAHNVSAKGELIKRYIEKVSKQQERIIGGLLCLRVYVESRLRKTKISQDFMKQLMDECKFHYETFFEITKILKDVMVTRLKQQPHIDVTCLNEVLADDVIKQVHAKASDRISEIEQYKESLLNKIDDVKSYEHKLYAICQKEQCFKKTQHHMSVITGIHSRFRRDKNIKSQMSTHDENIHGFEKDKLNKYCTLLKSTLNEHCLPNLEKLHRNAMVIIDTLTKCLMRVTKVEKNVGSVLNCQKLLSEKIIKMKKSVQSDLKRYTESGYFSAPSVMESSGRLEAAASEIRSHGYDHISAGFNDDVRLVSHQSLVLQEKLEDLKKLLKGNTEIIQSMDDGSLQSREPTNMLQSHEPTNRNNGNLQHFDGNT